tara:strand:- start:137 stop:316 length:180 start_codon:yes stop_codon:yes gene_type:complete
MSDYSPELTKIINLCNEGKKPSNRSIKVLRGSEREIALDNVRKLSKLTREELKKLINKD